MKSKEPKFEDALRRLEQIVEALETKEAALDQSLELFEEGVKLARHCQTKLEDAKRRVELLLKDQKKLVPFEEQP